MPISLVIQFVLLILTSLLFAAAFLLGWKHMRQVRLAAAEAASAGEVRLPHDASMGWSARAAVAAATVLGCGLLIWRGVSRQSLALAVSNPFDAFLLMGLLLAGTVIYFRWTRHLRGFSFFLLPMIVVLLVLGLVLAIVHSASGTGDSQNYLNIWTLVHVITIDGATICFTVACVAGIVYLLADRQLRRKGQDSNRRWFGWPPLASIERVIQWMVYWGFPLLTISTVAGILRINQEHSNGSAGLTHGAGQAIKIGLGIVSWLVYATLLHVPFNPRFRGRRAAWLAIVGFVLFLAAYAAAKWS